MQRGTTAAGRRVRALRNPGRTGAPACAGAWIAIGRQLILQRHERQARVTLRRALHCDARAPGAHALLAEASLRLRRQSDAERHLRAWLRAEPENADAHRRLGALLSRAPGARKSALRHLERAWQLAPRDPAVAWALADHWLRSGRPTHARPHLLRAARRGNVPAQTALAGLYARQRSARARNAALRWWIRAAHAGDAEACFQLGVRFDTGEGLPRDPARAARLYLRAARGGLAAAQHNLGLLYAQGRGVRRDARRAARWYARAAERGEVRAQSNLGCCYAQGLGVPRDPARARHWFERAARRGHALAQFNAGVLCESGEGGPRDAARGLTWLRRAVRQGCDHAAFYLGILHEIGDSAPHDPRAARRLILRAAASGHGEAQLHLAHRALRAGGSRDGEAAGWLLRAASQGVAEAEYLLAFLYHFGRGVPHDPRLAWWWMSRAAHRGHVDAEVCLGVLLVRGEGVRSDPCAAAHWFARAAEHGDAPAQRRLARCYASGIGVPVDPAEAWKWLTLACQAGDSGAQELRDALAGELTARQRWEAQRRAREWTLRRAQSEREAIA